MKSGTNFNDWEPEGTLPLRDANDRNAGISYSRFIEGLKAANIGLDRKVLADLAVRDAVAFNSLVKQAQDALKAKAAKA